MNAPFWQIMAQAPRLDGWAAARHTRAPLSLVPRLPVAARRGVSSLAVDFVDLAGAEAIRAEWQDLVLRSLEPNIFAEPAFALASTQHLAPTQRPLFALVRDAESRELLGAWMLDGRASPMSGAFVRVWQSVHAVLGAPVIDRYRAADVADAMLDAIGRRFGARKILLVPQVLRVGATYGLLVSRAMATGRAWGVLSPHARAVLRGGVAPALQSSRKDSKDLRRKARQLGKHGQAEHRSATTPVEIREAIERFLALESAGWKGKRKSALLCDVASATFTRAMLRTLAMTRQCRIDSLEVAGKPVAMAIVLNSAGRAYYWKIAYDEAFAVASPGVQLTVEVTQRQLADDSIAITDSCAVAGHPMIERLWSERQDMVDIAIAATPGMPTLFAQVLRRERLRRQAREWAKKMVIAARKQAKAFLPRSGNAPTLAA